MTHLHWNPTNKQTIIHQHNLHPYLGGHDNDTITKYDQNRLNTLTHKITTTFPNPHHLTPRELTTVLYGQNTPVPDECTQTALLELFRLNKTPKDLNTYKLRWNNPRLFETIFNNYTPQQWEQTLEAYKQINLAFNVYRGWFLTSLAEKYAGIRFNTPNELVELIEDPTFEPAPWRGIENTYTYHKAGYTPQEATHFNTHNTPNLETLQQLATLNT